MHHLFLTSLLLLLISAATQCRVAAQTTLRISETTAGIQSGQTSDSPVISAEGHFVAFSTNAALVPDDTNDTSDIYIRNLVTNTTMRVPLTPAGVEPNNGSWPVAVSSGGRYVLFESYASNLVPGDTNDETDAFLRDRLLKTTVRVSLTDAGQESPFGGDAESMTPDGRYVTFRALGHLTSDDTNAYTDAFRRDMQTGQLELISKSTSGTLGNNDSSGSSISADGRYVIFESSASNLVNDDFNQSKDVFRRDTVTHTTIRVSETASGDDLAWPSYGGGISADGRYVGFYSTDTNGWFSARVRDCQSGNIETVSVTPTGELPNNASYAQAISADGRYVLFSSVATNILPNDTNQLYDLFIRDRVTNTTRLVTEATNGKASKGYIVTGQMSEDGRYVVFYTNADDIVRGDTNGATDVFVRDMLYNTSAIVTTGDQGIPGNADSSAPTISADGRFIVFASQSTNFVSDSVGSVNEVYLYDRVLKTTDLVGRNAAGTRANNTSNQPAINVAGTHVAFHSYASNIVADDTNNKWDIFVQNLATGGIERASLSSAGVEGNDSSSSPALSANGRYVVFTSNATNLVPGDTNGVGDVFVRDLFMNKTVRVSVATDGTQANATCVSPDISGDGRYIVFYTAATNLVAGDTNSSYDVFVHDMQTGVTSRASVTSTGDQANHNSYNPRISGNGRYVTFYSFASNLAANDTNASYDIFVRDLVANTTRIVSVANDGSQSNGVSYSPSISTDGSRIAFYSNAHNLVPGDSNGVYDVFVRDLVRNTTRRVSISSTGAQGDADSKITSISGDGRYIAFESVATTLVPGDTSTKDIFLYGPMSSAPFAVADVALALRMAGGLPAAGADATRLNVQDVYAAITSVDIVDATRIARKVHGLEANP